MAIKTIRILKGPNTARLMVEAGSIIDPNMPSGGLTITLEHLGYPMFDDKTLPVELTEIKAVADGVIITGWLKVDGGNSRRFSGVYSGHRKNSPQNYGVGSIEIEVD